MASNRYDKGKCKGSTAVKAAIRHNDCSPEMRAIAAKGNPDIDISRSHLNVNLTGTSYAERCALYDTRIAELDAMPNANIRSDRVTGQMIETPIPADLPEEQATAFLTRVMEIGVEMYGAKNLISADIHYDERHEYVDSRTREKAVSRIHLQQIYVPEVNGRLCGKEFSSRKRMMEYNKKVHQMARDEFGVEFMTGKGKSRDNQGKSIAELKADSIVAAAEQKVENTEKTMRVKRNMLASRETRLAEREQTVKDAERAVEASRRAAEEIIARAEETARNRLKTAAEAIDQQYDILVDQADAVQRAADAVAVREQAVEIREQNAAREIAAGRRALAADVSSGVDDEGIKYKTSRALPTYGGN